MGKRVVTEFALEFRVDLSKLELLFSEAKRLTGHDEYVVVGSLAALGLLHGRRVPPRMLMSIDVDCYTRRDPPRIFDLQNSLGEGSPFEQEHGYFLDPVSPNLPTLPSNWEFRLIRIPMKSGVTVFFLDPNDTAVSKYARCEARDREWIQAGFAAGILSAPIIESRLRDTIFLDDAERNRAWSAFKEDSSKV